MIGLPVTIFPLKLLCYFVTSLRQPYGCLVINNVICRRQPFGGHYQLLRYLTHGIVTHKAVWSSARQFYHSMSLTALTIYFTVMKNCYQYHLSIYGMLLSAIRLLNR